jgi:serine/threonine protein kinase
MLKMDSSERIRYVETGGFGDVFIKDDTAFKFYHQPGTEKKEFANTESIRHRMRTSGRSFKHLLTYYETSYYPKATVTQVYRYNFPSQSEHMKKFEVNYKRCKKVPCLQMNYVQGLDGIAFHQKFGLLAEPLAIHLMIQLLEALDEFHSLGFLHRDVKPENLIITERIVDGKTNYHLTLIDYGLASAIPADTDRGHIDDRRLLDITYQWHMDVAAYQQGRYYVSSDLCSVGKIFLGLTGCRLRYRSKFMELLRKITSNNFIRRGSLEEALTRLRECEFESLTVKPSSVRTASTVSSRASFSLENKDGRKETETSRHRENSIVEFIRDGLAAMKMHL